MDYPPATRLDLVEELHGHRIPDPYRWLEDPATPETRAWLAAQDALTDGALAALPGKDALRARVTELLAAGVVTAPAWRGDRAFFLRRETGQEHARLIVREPGGERTLVDPEALDPSGITTLDAWQPDREGRLLAYQLSAGGTEESVLRVLDVATGAVVDGPIERTRYSPVAWLPGGAAFYYVRRLPPSLVPEGEEQYHRRVYLHRLGTDPDDDPVVFGEGLDRTTFYGVSVSVDGRWLAVTANEGTAPRNDAWLADLSGGDLARPDLREVQRGVDARVGLRVGRDGRLYAWTDRDAPRGRLCVASPEAPAHENWRELVPEDPEAVLDDYAIVDAPERPVLLVARTRHAISEVTVHDLGTGERLQRLELPGLGTVTGLSERPEGGHEAWLGYTDHVTPSLVLHYDARDGALRTWATAPGAVRVPPVRTEQVTYRSKDGTPVRMLVMSPETDGADGIEGADGTAERRPRPTILWGYGGFSVPMTPGYNAAALAWVEAGGCYAVANLRGGSEEGEDWHRAGMRERKQNVFDDFVAAAERLVADGRTTAGQLAIHGGSNGGLLVGAALTQRPELYAAVVCSAPLLDMVRYERSGLGALWTDEYGTAAKPDELEWLLAYSPYHHVREGVDYPATLFTVFDADTRVDPMHARKTCAALQRATSGERPVLLRRERDVGHSSRSISRAVTLAVDVLAFIASRTGLLLAHPVSLPRDGGR
ncbi:MAG: prolyl oligopeptidase family serine peptidase [Frankiaceae bacterium]